MSTTGLFLNMLHPGLLMIIVGLIVAFLPYKAAKWCYLITPIVALDSLFFINESSSMIYKITDTLQLNLVHCDKLSFFFLLAFCIIAVIATIYSAKAETTREMAAGLVYAGCNMGVVLAADCLSLLIFWELSALASAYLVYCRHTNTSVRATFRYLLVHAFGGSMLLVGFLMYMSKYGNTLENITSIAGTPTFWVIMIGVAVNTAMPPINSWLPDAYPESTLGGTVFLGSYTTKAAIYLLIRLFAGTEWLVWMGAFMAVYGIIMALLENDIRRLLSYHIISQLGYMVAALGAGGAWGIDGAAAHTFSNIMYKGVLLMAAGAVIYATGKRKISELGGLAKKMPVTAICFLIASLAIAGVPFLNGFASKALVMHAVEEGGFKLSFWALTAASIGTWLSITLKINWFVFWGPTDRDIEIKNEVPGNMKLAMILGAAICVVTGVCPQLVYNITPFATNAHPFTLSHIFEYIVLFIGATLIFWLLRKKMEPHDELSLDFDWLYRKGLNKFILFLSRGLYNIFDACGNASVNGVRDLSSKMSDTSLWKDNTDEKIGDIIGLIIIALVLMFLVAALVH